MEKLLAPIFLFLFLTSCSFTDFRYTHEKIPDDWQRVTIRGVGSFGVPAEWNVEEHDGILFITDKPMENGGYTIHIVGATGIQPYRVLEGVERIGSPRYRIINNGPVLAVDTR